jgi:tyrosine-protein kinase Etk/Wzc
MALDIDLNISDYRIILRKRLFAIVLVFLSSVAISVVYTRFQIPMYRAQTIVRYEPPLPKLPGRELTAPIELSLLSSMDMLGRVAKRINVPVSAVQNSYTVQKMGISSLLLISAKSANPDQAARLANAVAESFIEWDLEQRSKDLRIKYNEVSARKKEMESSLRVLEEQREAFLKSHQTTSLGVALANNLLEMESRRKEMLRKFTPEHPEVLKLDQRIQLLSARLAKLPGEQNELMRIDREIKVREEIYLSFSRQEEQAKVDLESTLSYVTVVSPATTPSAPYSPRKWLNYTAGIVFGLFFGFYAALLLESLDISITRIEEIEKVLESRVLGVIPHFGSRSRWEDFKLKLLRRNRHSEKSLRSLLVACHSAKSLSIEVYHSLRINIQAQLSNLQNMVLTFTSASLAEGKTLTSINFALASAHSGLKTLLIEGDIRRPILYKIFGLPKEPGLIEVLTGKVPWEDTVRGTVDILMGERDLEQLMSFPGIDNFKIMTGWSMSIGETVNLFASQKLSKLIAEMRPHFDVIIFDCPPILLFADAMLIGQHTDGVVLIYKLGQVARRSLKRARDQILFSKGNILGVVLNGARSTDLEPGYGDYAYYYKKKHGESV